MRALFSPFFVAEAVKGSVGCAYGALACHRIFYIRIVVTLRELRKDASAKQAYAAGLTNRQHESTSIWREVFQSTKRKGESGTWIKWKRTARLL